MNTISMPSRHLPSSPPPHRLTVRFLVPRTRTWTAEFLGLAPPVVSDEQRTVVLHERLLQLVLGVLVDVFLVVGDDGFGDGLADGVDLRGVSTTGDADADVYIGCRNPISDMFLTAILCVRWIAHVADG